MPRLIFKYTKCVFGGEDIGLLLLKMHQAVEAEVGWKGCVWSYYLQLWGTWTRGDP